MHTDKITIRKANLNDVSILEKISVDTFTETFAEQNTKEDMDLFLKECFNTDAITSELKDENTAYYLSYFGNELCGYVKMRNASHPDFRSDNAIEIARIYVYKLFHGKKIGAALMQYVFDLEKK